MSAFTRDEIIAQLVARNVPRHMAERTADAELGGLGLPPTVRGTLHAIARPGDRVLGVELQPAAADSPPAIEWPVRLLLPWSLLVSDNERKEPYVVITADGPKARMRLTDRYAEAKAKIEQLAKRKLDGAAPAEQLLELTAKVYVPGGRVGNDVSNFGKGVHDALEKIVYRNDNQLRATHWLWSGVDVDAPRAEITITPLVTSGG